ncbi:MAG: hypothetical protein A3H49_12855 [Nitrospirae bacterium RIFCSPLOWO2_02_FULL_62_14]|nr:MAG: hypothetical protein A3H49_12855 [Nitrospirae bacterium RIFCSPLOWO2_02_FULL_62_14]
MRWKKMGVIFQPPRDLGWMATHAALPCVDQLDTGCRIYFSGRDEKGRAQVGFFEVDLADPAAILRVSEQPVISIGPVGTFDDHGVTGSWVVTRNDNKYHYYTGWSLGRTVPFYLQVGLAVSTNGGKSFEKVSQAPLLDRTDVDPYLTASPCVLIESGVWRMWYVSGTGWKTTSQGARHYYHIKYAESSDGIEWKRKGVVCIDYRSPDEHAISRPCIVKDADNYKMWYAYRGEVNRIGYAESQDGIGWTRKDDDAGIVVSASGWDSEMIAYPFVFDHGGTRYMLYNGNGYGKTGIGLAVHVED